MVFGLLPVAHVATPVSDNFLNHDGFLSQRLTQLIQLSPMSELGCSALWLNPQVAHIVTWASEFTLSVHLLDKYNKSFVKGKNRTLSNAVMCLLPVAHVAAPKSDNSIVHVSTLVTGTHRGIGGCRRDLTLWIVRS